MANAGCSAAVRRTGALAHFNKYQCAVGRAHDEIDLPATASWCPIIGLYQLQPGLEQAGQRGGLCGIAFFLGAQSAVSRPCWRGCHLFSGKPH